VVQHIWDAGGKTQETLLVEETAAVETVTGKWEQVGLHQLTPTSSQIAAWAETEDRKIMRRAEENPYRNRAKQKLEQCRKHTKDKRMTWQQGTEMQSSRPGGNSVQRERNPNQENAAPGREKL
jgi:hypothetical protein